MGNSPWDPKELDIPERLALFTSVLNRPGVEIFENSSFGKWEREVPLASVMYSCYLPGLSNYGLGGKYFKKHLTYFLYKPINRTTYKVEDRNPYGKESEKVLYFLHHNPIPVLSQ